MQTPQELSRSEPYRKYLAVSENKEFRSGRPATALETATIVITVAIVIVRKI